MSRALEPGEQGELWLSKHDDTPRESRPVVLAKAPSGRESRQLSKEWDAAFENKTQEQNHAAIEAIFFKWVVGWDNFDCEFNADNVSDKFTVQGMREIVRGVVAGAVVSAEDKKK